MCAIVNEQGEELPRGSRGIIGVRQPNPCTMLEYWKNPEATAKKYAGEFLLTGDLGVQDEDGYFWYVSREDDVITTAGYRVGPSEIEHTLMKHPAVAMSAVVGIPDPIRTESIKAWIVLRPGFAPGDALAREIQDFVKVQLAAHEYPRFVQFTETLADDRDGQGAAARVAGAGVAGKLPSLPGLTRQSILLHEIFEARWIRGSSPRMTIACAEHAARGLTQSSYPAKAGYPVRRGFSAL